MLHCIVRTLWSPGRGNLQSGTFIIPGDSKGREYIIPALFFCVMRYALKEPGDAPQ